MSASRSDKLTPERTVESCALGDPLKLHIYVVGDRAEIAKAERAWDVFEKSFATPFTYDKPAEFRVCVDTDDSELAECRVHNGVAEIRVTPLLLAALAVEQNLTLLHESLHIASFTGTLRDMYAAVNEFTRTYAIHCPIARLLGQHLFEVDAKFALREHYGAHAADRTACLIQQREETIGRWYSVIPATHPVRPYYVLLDQLRAELAGVLADDDSVTQRLCSSLEQASEPYATEIATLHRMLSPKSNDFKDLSQWGADTYEAVVRRVTESV